MYQTGHLAPVLRLYRHYKAPATLGDDGLLQEFLVMGGVDHTVQPLPNGRCLGLNLPPNVVKLFRCLVRHFLRTDNAGKDPVLQIFVHRNAVKKEIQGRACTRQMAVPVVQNAQRPQGVAHLQQLRHIQAPAGCRPLQRTVYIMQPAKRRRAEPGQHRKSVLRLIQQESNLPRVCRRAQRQCRLFGVVTGGLFRQKGKHLIQFQGLQILIHISIHYDAM